MGRREGRGDGEHRKQAADLYRDDRIGRHDALRGGLREAEYKESCTVLANYLTDYSIQEALVAAERRGVAVTAVLNPTGYGEASAAAWLRRGGVHVELAPARPYLHAKILAWGSEAMIGSANFSYDGIAINHKLDIVLDGRAAAAVGAFAAGVARADGRGG